MISGVIVATIVVAGVGVIIGLILGLADMRLHVDIDDREAAILEALPGSNCGGCGYPGCSGCATAIAKGKAAVNQCPVGGTEVAKTISEIMGVEVRESARRVAFVHCAGDCEQATQKYEYTGAPDCRFQAQVPGGGAKTCEYGCLGGGTCESVCRFDAIHVYDGVAIVDKHKCKACGMCVEVCPRHLIDLIPYDAQEVVSCSSHDRGQEVNSYCKVGCIACHICEKNCPADAIYVENNCAHIDQDRCVHCDTCVKKCPKKAIAAI